jgi:hypothetical protein
MDGRHCGIQIHLVKRDLYVELIKHLEEDWEDTYTNAEQDKEVALFVNLLNFRYLCGLSGKEIMKTDISPGFLKYLNVGAADLNNPDVIVPLIGRLKGETGKRYHMMVMVRVTASGVMVGRWADWLG